MKTNQSSKRKCCKCNKLAKYNVNSAIWNKNFCEIHIKKWRNNMLCIIKSL